MYIFEDFWNNAEPHTPRLEKNLQDAEEISIELEDEFLLALAIEIQEELTIVIGTFIAELKEKEKVNGGFPNTDLMINALEEAIIFRVDTINTDSFDYISEQYRIKFEE